MTTSGIVPWRRQLELCDRWLEIIAEELLLRGEYLTPAEAAELNQRAEQIAERGERLVSFLSEKDGSKAEWYRQVAERELINDIGDEATPKDGEDAS
jgi:hypothetical protein